MTDQRRSAPERRRRSRRRGRATLVVGLLTLTAFVLGTLPTAAGSVPPSRSPAASPEASATPTPAAGPAASGTPSASAGTPAPAAAAAPLTLPPGVTTGTPPEPHVITSFAGQLQGARKALPTGKVLTVPVRSDVDGCDRNYGEPGRCVPETLPNGRTDVCAYLTQHGIKGVRVKGVDARSIDQNHNGVVCD